MNRSLIPLLIAMACSLYAPMPYASYAELHTPCAERLPKYLPKYLAEYLLDYLANTDMDDSFSLSVPARGIAKFSFSFVTQAYAQNVSVGSVFPDIHLPAVRGASRFGLPEGAFALHAVSHPIVVLNLYSWFCGPCRAEAPMLVALQDQIHSTGLGKDVLLLGIATGDDSALVRKFRDTYGITYPLVPDPDLTLHAETGGTHIPFMYVLRRENDRFVVVAAQEGAPEGGAAEVLDWIIRSARN